ncbi:PP2C family protein-serine/threonine phosphatase [Gimesia maris]|uniref:PP2C family protein-serine/threonine phosphatase n=1 Tax=Planctomycetia TaxID=203683 RepID=UPI003A8D972A
MKQVRYSTATLLLLAVNFPLAVLAFGLLFIDYQRELERTFDLRRTVLQNEAALIGQAFTLLGTTQEQRTLEKFITRVCSKDEACRKRGHEVEVVQNGNVFQSHCLPKSGAQDGLPTLTLSSPLPPADESESNPLQRLEGRFRSEGLSVTVVESIKPLRSGVLREVFSHFGGLLVVAALAGLITDVAILRLIGRPTADLSNTVQRIAKRIYDPPTGGFASRELNELLIHIQQMANALEKADQEHALNMQRAMRIQTHLLPSETTVEGLEFSALYQPAAQVAGDTYDILPLADGSSLIFVADVVGHGVAAAMSASILKMLVESCADGLIDPGAIICRVNARLPKYLHKEEFATMVIARWQPDQKRFTVASAGHEPTWIITDGELRALEATGLPLGVDPDACWETNEIKFSTGDLILFSTDGLAEAHNTDGVMLGRDHVARLLKNHIDQSPAAIITAIEVELRRHLDDFPMQDDNTVIAIRCKES